MLNLSRAAPLAVFLKSLSSAVFKRKLPLLHTKIKDHPGHQETGRLFLPQTKCNNCPKETKFWAISKFWIAYIVVSRCITQNVELLRQILIMVAVCNILEFWRTTLKKLYPWFVDFGIKVQLLWWANGEEQSYTWVWLLQVRPWSQRCSKKMAQSYLLTLKLVVELNKG